MIIVVVYCVKCGVKNLDDAKFCVKCGENLMSSQEARALCGGDSPDA